MGFALFAKFELFHYLSTVSSSSIICVSYFIITCLAKLTLSEDCAFVNDCKCVFRNGSEIDLTSLGYHGEPRWKDVKPSLSTDNFTYSYNPCFKFSIGNGACENVEVCQTAKDGQHYNIGNRAMFSGNGQNGVTNVSYAGDDNKKTTVMLVCSPEDSVPRLNVTGEVTSRNYIMTMWSKCACADLCREGHLSAGSVLVILLMIGIALYLVLGIIHSSLTRGAHGWELIPHYEFWVDFPLLVRDGCVFVISGCKPETAYERI
ncbi:cation-dependent mannose-6-phosphate receptor-like [Argiope bruennichi]|uniref:Cation-dependent mannose-6-phosphate receptor like protein n=1 Tax=Argiope bruennichi TaxID=94029 RepID=A0A8T0G4R7_ARGBR|nr:cation-dependent mannose-6-phosphate receptor-like [Argiope bruennichi]KAF8796253.1 Cation-dependent mannose-6-phosphate receptor like protein [Argiope bruennichi]